MDGVCYVLVGWINKEVGIVIGMKILYSVISLLGTQPIMLLLPSKML